MCVTWCGKVYPRDGVTHLLERVEGIVNTCRPATVGEAEAVSPSRELDADISAAAGRIDRPSTYTAGRVVGRN